MLGKIRKRAKQRAGRVISRITNARPLGCAVVLSLPKCGSTTLAATIKNGLPWMNTFHTHVLSTAGVENVVSEDQSLRESGYEALADRNLAFARECLRIRERVLGSATDPVFVTGLRDPVAIAVSAYFEGYHYHRRAGVAIEVDEVRRFVEEEFFVQGLLRGGLDEWFENEVKGFLGIDVLGQRDRAAGAEVLENERGWRLAILRLEDFDQMGTALGQLFRAPAALFPSVTRNDAQTKPYDRIYREIAREIRFSEAFLDQVYSSRYLEAFYSTSEIDAWKRRWTGSPR